MIAEEWKSYMQTVYPEGIRNPEQMEQVKQAFYGGALAAMKLASVNNKTQFDEINKFFDDWKLRHGK